MAEAAGCRHTAQNQHYLVSFSHFLCRVYRKLTIPVPSPAPSPKLASPPLGVPRPRLPPRPLVSPPRLGNPVELIKDVLKIVYQRIKVETFANHSTKNFRYFISQI